MIRAAAEDSFRGVPPPHPQMLYYWILFFFVAFGAKVILAFAMIYFLLPSDRFCGECSGETLLMQGNRLVRTVFRLTRGHMQQRWCPGCGWEGLARRAPRLRTALVRQAEPRRAPAPEQ